VQFPILKKGVQPQKALQFLKGVQLLGKGSAMINFKFIQLNSP